ncbi:MAG: sulfite exporter TauE/SafE family protein [Gammaproteobacteria bacterium]|nr:sulfite exporter TauE/SafE family protein [Gammaproteobacteria bacterium]
MIFALYILVGSISGLFSGLLGIGGGLIVVPSLMIIFSHFNVIPEGMVMHFCIGTSLTSTIVNLLISTTQHNKTQSVRWDVVKRMLPGVLLGSFILGPILMLVLNGAYLKIIFGSFCVLLSLYMLYNRSTKGEEKLPTTAALSVMGFFVAGISTLLGIAGGAIIGALFNIWHMNSRQVVGTIAAIGIPIVIPGTIGLIAIGYIHPINGPAWSTGYIYWPAVLGIGLPSLLSVPVGASLTHKISRPLLRKVFAYLVLIVGLKMLF